MIAEYQVSSSSIKLQYQVGATLVRYQPARWKPSLPLVVQRRDVAADAADLPSVLLFVLRVELGWTRRLALSTHGHRHRRRFTLIRRDVTTR